MVLLKKLLFCIPLLFLFIALCVQTRKFFQNPYLILLFDNSTFQQVILLTLVVLLTSVCFVIFSTLAQEKKIVLLIIPAISLAAFLFLSYPINIILMFTIIMVSGIEYLLLERKLQSYLTFQATTLLVPSIIQTSTLLFLGLSISFYFASQQIITKQGITIPESLLSFSTQFLNLQQPTTLPNQQANMRISPQQLTELKNNPELLKQFGIDSQMLSKLEQQQTPVSTQDIVKQTLQQQIQLMIKPYMHFIPLVLTIIFFITLKSIASILGIILSPLIWIIFTLLEAIHVTTYTLEMREVKKLIV